MGGWFIGSGSLMSISLICRLCYVFTTLTKHQHRRLSFPITAYLRSDPAALYLRGGTFEGKMADVSQQLYLQHVKDDLKMRRPEYFQLCTLGKRPCIWGCSESVSSEKIMERKILCFENADELEAHISTNHKYCSPERKSSHREDVNTARYHLARDGWARVPEGEIINLLCGDLAASILARRLDLLKVATTTTFPGQAFSDFLHSPLHKPATFNMEKLLDLSSAGKGSVKISVLSLVSKNTDAELRGYLQLWSKICRLFAVEANGEFRLRNEVPGVLASTSFTHKRDYLYERQNINETNINEEENFLEVIGNDIDKWSDGAGTNISYDQTNDKSFYRSENDCFSCCVDNEMCNSLGGNILCEKESETLPTKEQIHPFQLNRCRFGSWGIRCALLMEKCSPLPKTQVQNAFVSKLNSVLHMKDDIDVLRILLLKVASRVPDALRNSKVKTLSESEIERLSRQEQLLRLLGHNIWNESFRSNWVSFVKNSLNARMISQAFLMLLCSVNKNKMPQWWRAAKGGWMSALIGMHNSSFSALAMRLYMFDLAVAEFIGLFQPDSEPTAEVEGCEVDKFGHIENSTLRADNDTHTHQVEDFQPSPNETNKLLRNLQSMVVKKRMQAAMKMAKELSLSRYDGEGSEECYRCNNGGDLLICEFCENVQHPECFDPPIKEVPDFDFVCDECLKLITECYDNTSTHK